MRTADLRPLRIRLRVAEIAVLSAFLLLTVRAAYLALVAERPEERGRSQLGTTITLPPERGRILDRNGDELALTVAVPSVYGVPTEVADPAATAREVARILGVDPQQAQKRLERRRSFVYLDRWADPSRVAELEARALPGIGVVDEPRRAYPFGPLGATAVGFANIDGHGVRGIEEKEDAWLVGRPRRVPVERDARGQLLLGSAVDRTATAGGDVTLTIDVAMQAEAEMALVDGVEAAHARGGLLVALDPRTGEVLALAQVPRFDPNDFRELSFPDTRARTYTDAVEPGSTFKTFLIAAAIDAGVVRPTDVFDLRGGVRVPGKWIRDPHPKPILDVAGILRHSSNVGAVKIAQKLGPRPHEAALRRFGFGSRTGAGFPDESSGLLRPSDRWRPVDAATVAFGQGVSVTGVQLAAATAALGNDGVWIQPHLVRGRRRPDGTLVPIAPPETRRAVSAATAATMRRLLEGVVVGEGGTGKRARLRGVAVGGKTGTAQKLDPKTHRYATSKYVGWFIGLAPVDAPRVAIVVAIDEPHGVHTGGMVAAPIFARVAAAILTQMGIPTEPLAEPPGPAVRTAARETPAARRAAPGDDAEAIVHEDGRLLVPDLHGLTVDEVKALVADAPVELEIYGRGRAVAQEPDPGTVLPTGRTRLRVRFTDDGGRG